MASASSDKTVRLHGMPMQIFLLTQQFPICLSRETNDISILTKAPLLTSQTSLFKALDNYRMRGEERLLWLPYNRKARCSAIYDSLTGLVHTSGNVSFMSSAISFPSFTAVI